MPRATIASLSRTPGKKPGSSPTKTRGDTRERLLKAAVELFDRYGFEGTSMRALASAVGLKAPAVYNHFKSKEEILLVAVNSALEAFNDSVVAQDDAHLPALVRLDGMIDRHVSYQIENYNVARSNDRLLSIDVIDRFDGPSRKKIRGTMRLYFNTLSEIVGDAAGSRASAAAVRVTALSIGTMCDHVNDWYRADGSLSQREVIALLSRLAKGMIKAL